MSTVDSAKNLFAPPFTPSKLILACSATDGISSAYDLKPEAVLNTPIVPPSATKLPPMLPGDKSLSPLNADASNC